VSLRVLVNGTAIVLDSATLPVTLGQWYTLRLEAVGNLVRGYVNGTLLVEAADTTHESGAYGAMVFKTQARYDDFTAIQP
jgi:pectate lyase